MGQNDQVAIASPSGQIGFLQPLTNDRMVLRTALDRLTVKVYPTRDNIRPPMTEYQAELIERYDRDLLEFFIAETLRNNPGITRDAAEGMVQARAQQMQTYAAHLSQSSLAGLESLVKSSRSL